MNGRGFGTIRSKPYFILSILHISNVITGIKLFYHKDFAIKGFCQVKRGKVDYSEQIYVNALEEMKSFIFSLYQQK